MTIEYTEEAKLPLADTNTENWGAIINSSMEQVDAGLEITCEAAEAISAYDLIYLFDFDTTDDIAKVKKAKADSWSTMPAIGIAPESIPYGSQGKVRIFGWIDITDSGLSVTVPATLYVSAATAGKITSTPPTIAQRIGFAKSDTGQLGTDVTRIIINLQHIRAVTKKYSLPIPGRIGSAFESTITGTRGVEFDVDNDYTTTSIKTPPDWDGISDLTLKALIQNEIAEDDGDDIIFDALIHGIVAGETNADAGQNLDLDLNLTGGNEGINRVNEISATIDYDHGTYPISPGDLIVIKMTVSLGGAGECTGALFLIDWWLEYTAVEAG